MLTVNFFKRCIIQAKKKLDLGASSLILLKTFKGARLESLCHYFDKVSNPLPPVSCFTMWYSKHLQSYSNHTHPGNDHSNHTIKIYLSVLMVHFVYLWSNTFIFYLWNLFMKHIVAKNAFYTEISPARLLTLFQRSTNDFHSLVTQTLTFKGVLFYQCFF